MGSPPYYVHMARMFIIAALLLTALIGGGAALIIRAQSDDEAADLRLSARRLADGSVELGLQRRTEDGWSAHILPDGRFLSLDVPNDEWFNSAAFALSEPGRAAESAAEPAADGAEPTAEAGQAVPAESEEAEPNDAAASEQQEQPTAGEEQAEEETANEGRSEETAAQETGSEETAGGDRQTDGPVEAPESEERAAEESAAALPAPDTPADRIIDAVNDARALRISTPPPPTYEVYRIRRGDTPSGIAAALGVPLDHLLELNGLTPATLIFPDQQLLIPRPSQRPLPAEREPVGPSAYAPIETPPGVIASAVYGTIRNQPHGAVQSAALITAAGGARLTVACIDDALVAFVSLPSEPSDLSADAPSPLLVYYRLDDGPLRSDRWRSRGGLIAAPDAPQLVAELDKAAQLSLRINTDPQALHLTFQVADLLATPIQPNLDRCGAP